MRHLPFTLVTFAVVFLSAPLTSAAQMLRADDAFLEGWREEMESPPRYSSGRDNNIWVGLKHYPDPAEASVIFEFMLETLQDETLRFGTRSSAAGFAAMAEAILGGAATGRLSATLRTLATDLHGRSMLENAMSSASDRFRNTAIAWIKPALRASPERHPREHVSEAQQWVWVLQEAEGPGATALKELLESDGIRDPEAARLARGHLASRGG